MAWFSHAIFFLQPSIPSYQRTSYSKFIKSFWRYQTEIHLPPIVGLCPSHASGRRILSGNSLKEEGVAGHPGDKQQVIERLMTRGLTYDDALTQYEAELRFFKAFQMHSSLVYAPSMKITFGEIEC